MGKPAGIGPPANQKEERDADHLIFLPLIVVILEVKAKITRTYIIRKPR